jgi:predicted  nucleic acid-binding Zn-ribbon protein
VSVHQDLLPVAALLRNDQEIDALRKEAVELGARVERAKVRVTEAEAALVKQRTAISENIALQADLDKKHKSVAGRAANLKAQLEGGAAMNYDAALHQQALLQQQLDSLDEQAFAALEASEALEAARIKAEDRKGITEVMLRDALDAQKRRRPDLELRFKEVQAERKERHTALRPDLRVAYDDMRDRKKPVLVTIVDDICSCCRMNVPPQLVFDVLRETKLVVCRGCNCWFAGIEEPDDKGDEDDAAE